MSDVELPAFSTQRKNLSMQPAVKVHATVERSEMMVQPNMNVEMDDQSLSFDTEKAAARE